MSDEFGLRSAGGRIPDARSIIGAGRDHALAIGTESGRINLPIVPDQFPQKLAGFRVPDARCPIETRGRYPRSIGAVDGGGDRAELLVEFVK